MFYAVLISSKNLNPWGEKNALSFVPIVTESQGQVIDF